MNSIIKKINLKVKNKAQKLMYLLNPEASFCPSTIIVFVNDRCQLACKMCDLNFKHDSFANKVIKGKGMMSLDLFKKLIDSVESFKPNILFIGTEPLLCPDIVEMVRCAHTKNLTCTITTDGLALKEKAASLIDAGISQITISFDSADQELHNFIRSDNTAFQKTLEGLEVACQARKDSTSHRPRIGVHSIINNHNCLYIKEFASFFSQFEIDYVNFDHFSFVTQELSDMHNRLSKDFPVTPSSVFECDPKKVDVDKLLESLKCVGENSFRMPVTFFPKMDNRQLQRYYQNPEQKIEGYSPCYYPWKFAQVLPNGDVILNFRCFHNAVLGNIAEKDFKDIWCGRQFRQVRRFIKANGLLPACHRCFGLFSSHY